VQLWRWIVVFFTRPMRLSDVQRAWRVLRRAGNTPREPDRATPDFEPTRLLERSTYVDAWGRSQDVDVSEQPIETLPAELRDEFAAEKRRPKQP
jgi:hypothetical protein